MEVIITLQSEASKDKMGFALGKNTEEDSLLREFEAVIRQIGSDVVKVAVEPALLKALNSWSSDIEPALTALRELTKDIKDTAATLVSRYSDTIQAHAKEISTAAGSAVAALTTAVGKEVDSLRATISGLDLKQVLLEVSGRIEALDNATSSIMSEYNSFTKTFRDMQKEYAGIINDISDRIPDVSQNLRKLNRTLELAEGAIGNLERATEVSRTNIESLLKDFRGYTEIISDQFPLTTRAVVPIDRNLKTLLENITALRQSLGSVQEQLTGVGEAATHIAKLLVSLDAFTHECLTKIASGQAAVLEKVNQAENRIENLESLYNTLLGCLKSQSYRLNWIWFTVAGAIILGLIVIFGRGAYIG